MWTRVVKPSIGLDGLWRTLSAHAARGRPSTRRPAGRGTRGRAVGLAAGRCQKQLDGVWLGHTAEYLRVEGTAGLRDELVGSIHWYMAPVGAVLAVLAAWCGRTREPAAQA